MQCIVHGSGKEELINIDDMEGLGTICHNFYNYYELLKTAGVIIKTDTGKYKWTYSKTSLIDFFKHIKETEYGTWKLLESVFEYKPGTLRRLASVNGNPVKELYPDRKSKDFEKLLFLIG